MLELCNLRDTSRPKKKVQRIGRGIGSKRGDTSGRGGKGDSARQGYRKRFGYEGGQVPLYRKLPIRGFTRGTFVKASVAISLAALEKVYQDGETVSYATLREKGMIPRRLPGGIKILSNGELTKKIQFAVDRYSAAAIEKLNDKKIPHTIVE